MVNLIINEWTKLYNRNGTFVMLVMVVFLAISVAAMAEYDNLKYPLIENDHWKGELRLQIEKDRSALAEFGHTNPSMKKNFEREIAINEYRLVHNISPESKHDVWYLVRVTKETIPLAGIFVIVVAAGIVSSEFSWGTVKLLLIHPWSRIKILLSKYLTVVLFGLTLLAIMYFISMFAGILLFGFPEKEAFHLAYVHGEVIERNIVIHLIGEYLLKSVEMLMIATLAFMISAVFRNSNLAIGLSLFLLFLGEVATKILAAKLEWMKYFLFANTNLSVYFDGIPPVDGMTLTFSVIMLLVYFFAFHVLTFTVFMKRDIS